MAINIDEQYQQQLNGLMTVLPQNPFIVDLIGKAVEIGYEKGVNKDSFGEVLTIATKVAKYISDNNSSNFFKYNIIAAVLLAGVDPSEYETLDTASGTVKETTELFTEFVNNKGFKDMWMQLNRISQFDMDLFYAALTTMNYTLEDIIARKDKTVSGKYVMAGLAYIEASLRKSAITVPNRMYEDYNHFMMLVMKKAQF